jgi:hypothetical protein
MEGARQFVNAYRNHIQDRSLRPEEAASMRSLRAHRQEQARKRDLLATMQKALRHVAAGARGPSKPLGGGSTTTRSFHNVRAAPNTNAKVIAKLPGEPRRITVIGKKRQGGITWFQIRLREAIGKASAGDTAWITSSAVTGVASWGQFIQQLRMFERRNSDLSLRQRITKLRQMSQASDLPFDTIIGTQEGSTYLDTRTHVRTEWQLLKDYHRVRTPAGRVVDAFHVLVGLDVLPKDRRVEQASIYTADVGPNYSAATWSGDIGAAVADAYIQQDDVWERKEGITNDYGKQAVEKRIEHYYVKRASPADLIGNIDAWQMAARLNPPRESPSTIVGLLQQYYGNTTGRSPNGMPNVASGSYTQPTQPTGRKAAIQRFLEHYGFTKAQGLADQEAADKIEKQIEKFAYVWMKYRRSVVTDTELFDTYLEAMTDRFLNWLEGFAATNDVTLGGGGE